MKNRDESTPLIEGSYYIIPALDSKIHMSLSDVKAKLVSGLIYANLNGFKSVTYNLILPRSKRTMRGFNMVEIQLLASWEF